MKQYGLPFLRTGVVKFSVRISWKYKQVSLDSWCSKTQAVSWNRDVGESCQIFLGFWKVDGACVGCLRCTGKDVDSSSLQQSIHFSTGLPTDRATGFSTFPDQNFLRNVSTIGMEATTWRSWSNQQASMWTKSLTSRKEVSFTLCLWDFDRQHGLFLGCFRY
jgi:hypothetical protein